MFLSQYLRIVWARKWLVLGLFVLVCRGRHRGDAAAAAPVHGRDVAGRRGADRPGARRARSGARGAELHGRRRSRSCASERVASRAVKILGVERSAAAVAQWREATKAKIPLERYFAGVLAARPVGRARRAAATSSTSASRRRSDLRAGRRERASRRPTWTSRSSLRVAPARQSATFLDDQTKSLRDQSRAGAGAALEVPADEGNRRHATSGSTRRTRATTR